MRTIWSLFLRENIIWKSSKFEDWIFIETGISLLGFFRILLCFVWNVFLFICLSVCLFVLGTSLGELLLSVQLLPTQAQFLFHWHYSNNYWEPFLRTELFNTCPPLLCSALGQAHFEFCGQFWVPKYRNDVKLLWSFQRRAMRMVKNFEGKMYKEWLRPLVLFSLEETGGRPHCGL